MDDLQGRLERAYAYADGHAAGFWRTLVGYAAGKVTRAEALACLGGFQTVDGGWWGIGTMKAPLATISNTINGLHWLCMLEGADTRLAGRALDFVGHKQRADGSWDEDEAICQHEPRSWMQPGIYANQVWYTAAICRYVLHLGRTDAVDWGKALAFLNAAWDGGRFPEYAHTHWVGLYLYANMPGAGRHEQAVVDGCLKILQEFVARPKVNAGEVGEVGCAALGAGQEALLAQVKARVLDGQAAAGYWDFADGDAEDRAVNTAKVALFLRLLRDNKDDQN